MLICFSKFLGLSKVVVLHVVVHTYPNFESTALIPGIIHANNMISEICWRLISGHGKASRFKI